MEERVDEIDVFVVGIWFRSQMECIEFATKDIPEGLFQWSIEIVGYLQFVTGETVSTADSQRDKVHASKVSFKNIDQFLSHILKTYVPPILGILS